MNTNKIANKLLRIAASIVDEEKVLNWSRKLKLNKVKSKTTKPKILAILAKDKDPEVRRGVAMNPSTPPEALESLAQIGDVRSLVARNENTPPTTLESLAKNTDPNIRYNVAANPNTPPEALESLANDEEIDIRLNVASNPSTSLSILESLAKTANEVMIDFITDNPNVMKSNRLTLKFYV